eukprot:TRINITY_DN99_c0_g1_i1.p1 TRINITY_DN99_c0_g1~~TRINITY_DN99_c0_g1_i1.p1  ORF type:complete len:1126 (+),score=290.10 TRINITY_DN99_c0_g1_i1:48-3425(+)
MNIRMVLMALAAIITTSSGQWQTAKTTRYWDCCKPSCAWPSNANKNGAVNAAVRTCARDGSVLSDQDSKNICSGGGTDNGPAYGCVNQQPWEVTSTVAYGFAAANLPCSVCYEMKFTSSSLSSAGKTMVLQVTNSGDDLGAVHFDIQLPGGGFGIFNGCAGQAPNGQGQFNEPESAWGARYGGLSSISGCAGLPSELRSGCEFRFGWFENADNPTAEVRRVRCPDAIVDITGSRRDDDDQYPEAPGSGVPSPPTPPTPKPPTTPTPPTTPSPPSVCLPMDSSKCDCGWANAGTCGSDDGSLCNCMCCCSYTGSCNYNGGGGGGGGGSNCAMPAGVPSDPAPVNNRDFVACHGKLSLGGSSGLQLVDENGDAVQLIGMSSHGLHWFPNCYTKESITFLVENWGINLFRAAMYVGEGGYASNPSVKDTVKDIVQWCKELGIYAMIDWHMLSPGNPNDATYSGAADFWREMATLYKDEKHVLYEVANEPNGVGWSEVKQYHDGIIDVIRAVDSETIIICGTPTWSQDIDQAAANPVAKPYNVMYAFHFYAGTHTSLLGRVEQVASQIPLFVTEWGTSQASGDGGPYLSEAMQFLDLFASAGSSKVSLSFAQWSYADKNEVSAALTSNACSSKSWDSTSCSGTFLKNYIKSKVQTCSGAPPATPTPPSPTSPPVTQKPPTPPVTNPPVPSTPKPVSTNAPNPQTPPPTPKPVVTNSPPSPTQSPPSPPSSCREWDSCTTTPNCCPSGTTCFKKDNYYSQCRVRCPSSGWECSSSPPTPPTPPTTPKPPSPTNPPTPGTPTNPPSPTNAPAPIQLCSKTIRKWGGCTASPYCCDAGLKCFEKNAYYAQCLPECDGNSKNGWTCRDLSALAKDGRELGTAGMSAPMCQCKPWQKADAYCTDGSECSNIPRSSTCSVGESKCFGNSEAADSARKVMSFILLNGVSAFDVNEFKKLVKSSLRDDSAEVLIKYLCPASVCPRGQCSDPFGAASECLDLYALASRRGVVLDEEDSGSVVAFEIVGSDDGLVESFNNKQLPGVVSMKESWEPEGYDVKAKETDKTSSGGSSLGMILGIVLGALACLGLAGVAAFVALRKEDNQVMQTSSQTAFDSPLANCSQELVPADDKLRIQSI